MANKNKGFTPPPTEGLVTHLATTKSPNPEVTHEESEYEERDTPLTYEETILEGDDALEKEIEEDGI